jgi:hypothetical protein
MIIAQACGVFSFSGCVTITTLIEAILNSVLSIGWVIAAGFLAIGALQYITSAGDKQKATDAKTSLTNTLIGIVILLSIGIIFSLAESLFGDGTTLNLPTAPSVGGTTTSTK